jgi:hypothetical protein
MSDKLQPRTYAYAADGKKVYIEAITQDGDYVVSGVIAQIYGDQIEEDHGQTWIERGKLYPKPPVDVMDKVIEEKTVELARLRDEWFTAKHGINNAERDNADRFKRLAKFKGLERLEDVLEGKFSHFVTGNYGGYEIMTKERGLDQGDRYDKKLKLLSLFGDTGGDLEWRLNDYRDGSGSWRQVYPCASEDEARSKLIDLCNADLDDWRKGSKNNYYLSCAVSSLEKIGAPIPDDAKAAQQKHLTEAAQKQIAEASKVLKQAEAALAKAEGRSNG